MTHDVTTLGSLNWFCVTMVSNEM